jgi:hypothetical protein
MIKDFTFLTISGIFNLTTVLGCAIVFLS